MSVKFKSTVSMADNKNEVAGDPIRPSIFLVTPRFAN